MQELDDLQTVTQPEHEKTNRMAQAARRMRYPVAMCPYSYSLLECFLQAHKLKLPLHTINEHIDLQVMSAYSEAVPYSGSSGPFVLLLLKPAEVPLQAHKLSLHTCNKHIHLQVVIAKHRLPDSSQVSLQLLGATSLSSGCHCTLMSSTLTCNLEHVTKAVAQL